MVIPLGLLFSSATAKIVIDAATVAVGSFLLYNSTKQTAELAGATQTLDEDTCHTFFEGFWGYLERVNSASRSTKKHREENYPGAPQDLEKNPDWKETTHPGQAKAGSREFENVKTGEKIHYDKGKPGKSGHGANDHYHRMKPRPGSPGKYDDVDKNGRPVPKGTNQSHLYLPEGTSWD